MTYRVGDLKAATTGVVSVFPDSSLKEAISKMLLNNFSQLPVMSSERKIEGVISWKTIGTIENFHSRKEKAREYMNSNVTVLNSSDNLLDSVTAILDKEFVFVRNREAIITGIVTIYDIAMQFKTLSEPFIEIEVIENSIRQLINDHIPMEKVIEFCNDKFPEKKISSTSDLTFGEYIGIIENPELWNEFNLNLDRKVLIEKLHSIRSIRNELMHFRIRELPEERLKNLKDVSWFFRMLHRITKITD